MADRAVEDAIMNNGGGKDVHLLTGAAAVCFAFVLLWLDPNLYKDGPTLFATLSGTATLYGLLFAILEVQRSATIAQEVARSAKTAEQNIERLYGVRDATECQICIENALRTIDENGVIPVAVLSRISRMYVNEFADEFANEQSDVRGRIAMIESYLSLHRKQKGIAKGKLQIVLLGMNIHLSTRVEERKSLGVAQ